MRSVVERIFPWLLLAAAFTPLIFIDGLLYPYVAPKTLFLRGLAFVAAAFFVYLALSGRPFFFERMRRPSTWIPAGILAVAYGSTLASADFFRGFWSNFDRGDGLLSLTAVTAFFYLILVYADDRFFTRFLKVVTGTATIIALYALLQWIEGAFKFELPFVATADGRIGSTLGNAAFLSGYLAVALFVTLKTARTTDGKWRTVAYAGAVLQGAAIIVAATRGTLLALALVSLGALLWLAVRARGHVRMYAAALLAGLVLVAGAFVVFRSELAQVPFAPVQRVASISLSDDTVASRLFIWTRMLPEALQHPILGTGAESVHLLFNTIYDPGQILEQWFDRSHNAFLDYFVQYGAIGLVLYCALIASIAFLGYRRYRTGDDTELLFVALAGVYAAQNFFVFDTMSSLVLVLAILALLHIGKEDTRRSVAWRGQQIAPKTIPLLVGVLLLVPLWWVVWQPLRANLLLADGYLYHIVDIRRATASMREGFALGTYADLEYGYQAYEMFTDRQQYALSGEARVIAYRYAREVLQANYSRYPADARTATYLVHVLDAAPPEDPALEEEILPVLRHAIELSPKRAQPWYILANVAIKRADALPPGGDKNGLYRVAIAAIEEYASRVPGTSEPRYILATLYLTIGDQLSAKRWADEALPLYGYDASVPVAKRAARYYVTVGDWPLAARFLYDVAASSPDDYNALYDYAKAAFLAGEEEAGAVAAARVQEEAPELFASDPSFVRAYEAWVAQRPTP